MQNSLDNLIRKKFHHKLSVEMKDLRYKKRDVENAANSQQFLSQQTESIPGF